MHRIDVSRYVLPEPITTVPGFSGMVDVPGHAAEDRGLDYGDSANVTPLLIVTWLSKITRRRSAPRLDHAQGTDVDIRAEGWLRG